MKTWLRKLRGVVSIGAIWGLTLSVLGFAIGAIVSMIWHEILPSTVVKYVVNVALYYGIAGFLFGSGFAGVLTIVDGRKTFEELTPKRAALWGALTGVGVTIVVGVVATGLGIPLTGFVASICMCGAVTAGLGAGTVRLARRASAELETGTELHESKLLGDSGESIPHQSGPVGAQTLRSSRRMKRDERGGSG